MKLRFHYNKNITVGLVVGAIMLVLIPVVIYLAGRKDSSIKGDLLEYSENFVDSYGSSSSGDSIQKALVAAMRDNLSNDSIFYHKLRGFSRNMFEKGEQSSAIVFLDNLLIILDNSESDVNARQFMAYCHLLLGAATDEVGLTSRSHEYYFNGLKILDQIHNEDLKGDFYNNIGVSLLHSGHNEKARAYFDTAMNCAVNIGNSKLISIVHTNLAEIYSKEGKYDRSIDHLLKSIHTSYAKVPEENATERDDYYSLQSELGSLYLKSNNLPMAYACLSNAYNQMDRGKNKAYLYTTAYLMASYFNAVSEPDSAKKYMEIAWRTADAENNPYHRMLLYEKEMEMETENGDYKNALELSKKVIHLKDSLHNKENLYSIEQSRNIYDVEKMAMTRKSMASHLNPTVVLLVMGGFIICIVCLFATLIVRMRNESREKETQINKYSEEIRKCKALVEEEQDKSQKIDGELRLASQQMTSFTLERLKLDPRIEEISTDIKRAITKLPIKDKDLRLALNDTLSKLSVMKSDANWDDFQYYFENVHPDFYTRLDEQHPNLTAKDRRLCALVSLGLSTKDIASVTCLEVRSVESSRNRLRKKLGLDNDCNLFEYIKGLGLNG